MLKQAYPNKNIIVTEVGWPSNGASRRSPGSGAGQACDAGRAGQEHPRRGGLAAKSQNIEHFVVEAIDQPWKSYDLEGKAGGYWGLWNADRQQKFDWTGPIETFPQWWLYAAWSIAARAAADGCSSCGAGAASALAGQVAFCGLVCAVDQRASSTAPRWRPAPTWWSPRWWAGACSPSSW